MPKKLLVMGLPGAGKTTLARELTKRLNAVHFNADEIRREINKDLGFSLPDRIEQARRMGWLCDQVVKGNSYAIGDFVCPTSATRAAFGDAFVIWLDRIQASRFDDTNKVFEPPAHFDVRVTAEGTPEYWSENIISLLRPTFDPRNPTSLFVGRYQPFHDGHKALIEEGIRRTGQVCIAVRNTTGVDGNNPHSFEYIKSRIDSRMREYEGRYSVIQLPNISHIFYGRDVGYVVERIILDSQTESLSGTLTRQREASPGPSDSD